LWAIEHFGVEPDIMVIGKGLSGGIYPIGATCFRAKYETVFHSDPFIHISTFGGSEVGCPVALKVLEISSQPAFLRNVEEMGRLFEEGFRALRERHPEVLVSSDGADDGHRADELSLQPAVHQGGVKANTLGICQQRRAVAQLLIHDDRHAACQEILER
jgi:hypothetical protein